ncbi:MAG TPA: hypothetical protein VGB38_08050, partial [bacterium]
MVSTTARIALVLGLAFGSVASANAQNTVFEQKKAEYLETEGSKLRYWHERVWAWLEKIKLGQMDPYTTYRNDLDGVSKPVIDVLHNIIRNWGSVYQYTGEYGSDWPPYDTAWRWGEWYTSVTLIWILLRYGDVIYPQDRDFLINVYNDYIRSRDFMVGGENGRINDMTGRYLWAQFHKDAMVQFSYDPPTTDNIKSFSYGGKTYNLGSTYSAFELSRDWIYYQMENWVLHGNPELDSPNYTWLFVLSFTALYEHAQDPVMKQKAKMVVDFILLESVLDFSANQWGGALGRTYVYATYGGDSRFYWDVFWDFIPPSHTPSYAVMISSYRIPDIIYDIGDLSDEPDQYYHYNMEYNVNIVQSWGTGKWNYVTKFFNMGGRVGQGWELCILSTDGTGLTHRPGIPFRLWINDKVSDLQQANSFEVYSTMGNYGMQYKNAIFCYCNQVHYAIGGNKWDLQEVEPPWTFLKEGRVMLALQTRDSDPPSAGLELAIEGVDYATWSDFKSAIHGHAYLTGYNYTTTRGDMIGMEQLPGKQDYDAVVKKAGTSSFQFVNTYPFPRVHTIDYLGQEMVRWSG